MRLGIAAIIALVFLVNTVYAQHVVTNNDLMYQNFNEGSGTIAVDDAFGINNMTLGTTATWGTGYLDGGLDTGVSGATNASTLLDTFPENGTIDFFFTPTTTLPGTHAEYGLLSKQNTAGTQEMELIFSTDEERLRWITIAGTTVSVYSYNRTWTAGTWYHIGLVWNVDGGKQLYVNGVIEGNSSTHKTVPSTGTDTDFTVGKGVISFYDMIIDELVVANTSGIAVTTALNVSVRDEENLAPLENVSLIIYNTTSILYNNSDIDNNVTITPNWFGYFTGTATYSGGSRTQTVYTEYSSTQNITFYFPDEGSVYTFTTTSAGLPLNESTISIYRFINGTLTLITMQDTQVDGTAVFLLKPSVPHTVFITHDGCTSQNFNYIFSPVSFSIPVSMSCLGAGNITPNITVFPVSILWQPNGTYTSEGVTVSVDDLAQVTNAIWLNITRTNYTAIVHDSFSNLTAYTAVFTKTSLLTNWTYQFQVCIQRNNYTYCAYKSYINGTAIYGIGNVTAEDAVNSLGVSLFFLQLVFFVGLCAGLAGAYKLVGIYAVIILPFAMLWAVGGGLIGMGIGVVVSLISIALLVVGK